MLNVSTLQVSRHIEATAMADVVDDDDDESKVVAKFLLDTCLLQPSKHHVLAVLFSAYNLADSLRPRRAPDDDEIDGSPLITGSSAELYIQPMLLCVGDVDIMGHQSNELAIPHGYPPPTELPADFYGRVKVYEIMDSEYPGYVYLMTSYLLTEDSYTGKYNTIQYDSDRRRYSYLYYGRIHTIDMETNGPAQTLQSQTGLSVDLVLCIRCLWWPPQATDWPTRNRNSGWPDSTIIDLVVSNGCDLVQVSHRLCRQNKWKGKYQWRLSFSRAEIVLLNSWIPVQQIVYHILRVFHKNVRLTYTADSTKTKILSNYHFKTLTLWTCELKPQSWWIHDMNVLRISVKLLHMLADWLKNRICPHYFVNSCNLIDNTVHSDTIASKFESITESWLSTWFVNNYLRKCAQLCPDKVSRLFDDVSTSMKLQNAVSAVVDWRLNSALRELWTVCSMAQYYTSHTVSRFSLNVRSYDYWINELVKIDSCLRYYFTAVALLHIANRIAKHSSDDRLLDVLATIVGQFVGQRRYCHQLSSELSLNQAVILMKVAVNTSRSTVQQIEFELAKAYLYRALKCKDSDSDSIYCLANVYLAVLYQTSGQYQMAIDHCTLVMRSQDHSHCTSHVIQGDLLPKVDEAIDTVLGLAVFHQYVRTAALNQQTQYVVAFTTELFANYLYIKSVMKCRKFTQTASMKELQKRTKYVVDNNQLFIADVLLVKSTKMSERKCHYKPLSEHHQKLTVNAAEQDTSELVELLQQSAVEHLTTHRQHEVQRFGSLATFVTTDFEALYAYKRDDYQRCLQLSTQNVRTLLNVSFTPAVWAYPEFIQLMDNDIVSLTALTLIANPECRDDTCDNTGISQLVLSLYLMTQCQLKLHHSVTSLAKTLDYIEVAQRTCPVNWTLDHLTLKLSKREVVIHLSKMMQALYQI